MTASFFDEIDAQLGAETPEPPEASGGGGGAGGSFFDEIDAGLEADEQAKDAELRAIFKRAQRTKDTRALALEIARDTGADIGAIEKNLPKFQEIAERAKFDPRAFRTEAPGLYDLMIQRPDLAPMVVKEEGLLRRLVRGVQTVGEMRDVNEMPGVTAPSAFDPLGLGSQITNIVSEGSALLKGEISPTAKFHSMAGQEERAAKTKALQTAADERGGLFAGEMQTLEVNPLAEAEGIDRAGIYADLFSRRRIDSEINMLATKGLVLDSLVAQAEEGVAGGLVAEEKLEGLRQRAYDNEKAMLELERKAGGGQYYGQNALEQLGLDVAEGFASQLDSLAGLGKGGAIGATLGAVAGARGGAAGARAGAMAGLRVGAALGGGAASLGQETGSAYREFKTATTDDGRPIDPSVARGAAIVYGIAAAGVEVAELAWFAKSFGPLGEMIKRGAGKDFLRSMMADATKGGIFRRVAKGYSQGVAGEGVEEGVQEGLNILANWSARSLTSGKSESFDVQEAERRLAEASYKGLIASAGGLSLVGAGTSAVTYHLGTKKALAAGDQVARAGELSETETARAAPREVAELIKQEAEATGRPIKEVWIDPVKVNDTFTEQGVDPRQALAELMPEDGDQRMTEALEARRDEDGQRATLKVPLEEYVEKWGGRKLASVLAGDTTTSQGTMTKAEVNERTKVDQAKIQQRAQELVRETQARGEWTPASQAESDFIETLRSDLEATGRLTPEQVDQELAVAKAQAETMAVRLEKDVDDVMDHVTLRIKSQKDQNLADDTEAEGTDPATFNIMRRRFRKLDPAQQEGAFFRDRNTGVLNMRGFEALPRPEGRGVLAVFDVEGFKFTNDQFGHLSADGMLRAMAASLQQQGITDAAKRGGSLVAWVRDDAHAQELTQSMGQIAPQLQFVSATAAATEDLNTSLDSVFARQRDLKDSMRETGALGHRKGPPVSVSNLEAPVINFDWEAGKTNDERLGLDPSSPEAKAILKGAASVLEPTAERLKATARPEPVPLTEAHTEAFASIDPEAAFSTIYGENALLTDDGFHLALETRERKHKASMDMRLVRELNDAFGEEETDAIMGLMTATLAEEGGADIDAAHLHGDEFAAQHDNRKTLQGLLRKTQSRLKKYVLTKEVPGGFIVQNGIHFEYGIGKTFDEADRIALPRRKAKQRAIRPEFIRGGVSELTRRLGEIQGTQNDIIPVGVERLLSRDVEGRLLGAEESGEGRVRGAANSRAIRRLAAEAARLGRDGKSLKESLRNPDSAIANAGGDWIALLEKARLEGSTKSQIDHFVAKSAQSREWAWDWIAELSLLDDNPSEKADADYRAGKNPGPYGSGLFDGVNDELEIKDPAKGVSGAREAFMRLASHYAKKLDKPSNSWEAIGAAVDFMQKIDGYEKLQLPERVIEARTDALADAEEAYYREQLPQPAWHGTGARFDKFDLSYNKSGEGANAFGHGHYFASRRDLAEAYKNQLAGKPTIKVGGKEVEPVWRKAKGQQTAAEGLNDARRRAASRISAMAQTVWETGGKNAEQTAKVLDLVLNDTQDTLEATKKSVEHWKAKESEDQEGWGTLVPDTIKSHERTVKSLEAQLVALKKMIKEGIEIEPSGALYRVEIPEDTDLLDWDAPLGKQPTKVKEGLKAAGFEFQDGYLFYPGSNVADGNDLTTTGRDLYFGIAYDMTAGNDHYRAAIDAPADMPYDQKVSAFLAKFGIPGLRYLDGRSRDRGEGDHNYVVFEDENVSIEETLFQGESGQEQTETPAFKEWFGDSKVVDDEGKPLVVYHGTTADFDTFDNSRANPESNLGAGFYASNNPDETGTNYAGEGPDLAQKIQLEAERIAQETDREYDDADVLEEARAKYSQHGGAMMPLYLAIENPVVLEEGSGGTFLDFEHGLPEIKKKSETLYESDDGVKIQKVGDEWVATADNGGNEVGAFEDLDEAMDEARMAQEETGEFQEEGKLVEFLNAARELADELTDEGWDIGDSVVAEMADTIFVNGADNGGMTAQDLMTVLDGLESLGYITDAETGALAKSEFVRRVFARIGFDGFIDKTVDQKFGSRRQVGQKMEGVDADTVHYVAFEPTQLKSSTGNQGTFDPSSPNILEQPKRGWVDIVKSKTKAAFKVILTDQSDLSTPLHELSHTYLEMMGDVVLQEDAPEQIKQDWKIALNYLGGTDLASLTREQKEKWATAFETYLLEGRAPSVRLAEVFQRIRSWMIRIYNSLDALPGGLELTDDMRGVFDRLLATDEEIIQMQAAMGGGAPMFSSAAEAGMTEQAFREYTEDLAREQAKAAIRVHREVAQARQRGLSKEWRAEVKQNKQEAQQEWDRRRDSRLWRYIRRGEFVDPQGVHQEGLSDKSLGRLDRDLVRQTAGPSSPRVEARLRGRIRRGGESPVAVAEQFGFKNPREMYGAMLALPVKEEWIAARAEEITREKNQLFGEERDRIEEMAARSLHAEGTVMSLLREGEALFRRGRLPGMPPIAAIRAAAKELAAGQTVRRIAVGNAIAKERRHAEKAVAAFARGDFTAAGWHKKEQILNHQLFHELDKARADREQFHDLAKKFETTTRRKTLAMAGQPFVDAADQILEAMGTKPRETNELVLSDRVPLTEAIREIQQQDIVLGFDDARLFELIARPPQGGWKDLTVADMRLVRDALQQLYTAARERHTIVVDGVRVSLQKVAEEIQTDSEARPDKGPVARAGTKKRPGEKLQRGEQRLQGFIAGMTDPRVMFKELGPTAHKVLWQGYLRARKAEDELTETVSREIANMWDKLPKALQKRRYDEMANLEGVEVDENLNRQGRPNRQWMWMVALNMGNPSNMERLLGGYGWDETSVRNWLDREMEAEEWDFVQGVWDLFDKTLYPQTAKVYKEVNGITPDKIEAQEFKTRHGQVLKGGYFPARYDPIPSRLGEAQSQAAEEARYKQRAGQFAVSKSFTKARASKFNDIVHLDWSVVPSHVVSVVHYVAFERYVRDARRLINAAPVKSAVLRRLGARYQPQVDDWLDTVATFAADSMPESLRYLMWPVQVAKTVFSVRTLGYSVRVGLGDMTNALISWAKGDISLVDGTWSTIRMASMVGWPKMRRESLAASPELRNRQGKTRQYMRKHLAMIGQQGAKSQLGRGWDKAVEMAFILFDATDALMTTTVWDASYRGALRKGIEHDEAVKTADDAIQAAFPSPNVAEKPAILRDRRGLATLVVFFSYFSKLGNISREMSDNMRLAWADTDGMEGTGDAAKETMLFSMRWLAMLGISGALAELLSGRGPEEDEENLEWLTRKVLSAPAMMVPVIGSGIEELAGRGTSTLWHGESRHRRFSMRGSPMASAVEGLWMEIEKISDSGEDSDKRILALLAAIGMLTATPPGTSQVQRTAGYAVSDEGLAADLQEGDAAGIASGLLYGKREGQPASILSPLEK